MTEHLGDGTRSRYRCHCNDHAQPRPQYEHLTVVSNQMQNVRTLISEMGGRRDMRFLLKCRSAIVVFGPLL